MSLIYYRFREKYHPELSVKMKEMRTAQVLQRLEVFKQLRARGALDGLCLDEDCQTDIINLMDTGSSCDALHVQWS